MTGVVGLVQLALARDTITAQWRAQLADRHALHEAQFELAEVRAALDVAAISLGIERGAVRLLQEEVETWKTKGQPS